MSISNPIPVPASAAAGNVPDPVLRRPTFNADAQAFLYWLAGQTGNGDANLVALITNAYQNAGVSYDNATAAQAAAAGIDVPMWEPNENYHIGRGVKSPAAIAVGASPIYICKVAISGGTTDPYNDPTHWSVFTISSGVGGAIYTTSTTLTSASPFAIQISGGAGVWLKLPDATDGIGFAISNTGEFDLCLKKSNGDIFGFLQPKNNTIISSAGGKWFGDNILPIGITMSTSSVNTISTPLGFIKISESRSVLIANNYAFLFDSSTQSIIYSIVFRASGVTKGCATSINSSSILIASEASNVLQIDVITVSGDTLIVSASPPSFTASTYFIDRFINVNNTFVLYYSAGASASLRCVTVSGGTATIGSEYIFPSGASYKASPIFSSGSIIYAVYSGTGNIYCQPVSISGLTITPGTAASQPSSITSPYWFARAFMMPNGNICAHHANGGNFVASFFKPNGNAVTGYSAIICSHSDYSIFYYNKDASEYIVIDSNKVFFAHTSGSLQNQMYFNLITDNNNGTATAGTAVNMSSPSNLGSTVSSAPIFCEVKAKNTQGSISIAVSNYGKLTSQTPARWEYKKTIMTFNCETSSPSLSSSNTLISDAFVSDIFDVTAQTLLSGKDVFGGYDPSIFNCGDITYSLAQRTNWAAAKSQFANALIGACGKSAIKAIGEIAMPQYKLNSDNGVFYSAQSIGGKNTLNVYEIAK